MNNPYQRPDSEHDSDLAILVAPAEPIARRPSMWQVVLLNDDFTAMEFVVVVLIEIFGMSRKKAEALMMDIHNNGRGIAGIYSHEVAQMKHREVESASEAFGQPLKAVLEKAPGADSAS